MDRSTVSTFGRLPIIILIILFLVACIPYQTPLVITQSPSPTGTHLPSDTPSPSLPLGATLTPSVTPLPQLDVKPDLLKGVTVTFWHPWAGATASSLAEIVDEFNQVNIWGISVKLDSLGDSNELIQQIKNDHEADSIPDIIAAPINQIINISGLDQSIINLNDYITSSQWGMQQQEIDDFYPTFWSQDIVEGYRFGIPAFRDAHFLIYNQTWAQEMGFNKPPEDLNGFTDQNCAAIQSNIRTQRIDKIGTGGWLIATDPIVLFGWFLAFGLDSPDKILENLVFNSKPSTEAFDYLSNLFNKNCIWLGRIPTPYEYFANRQALFYSGTISDIPAQTEQQVHWKNNDIWSAIPYPSTLGKPLIIADGPSYAMLRSNPNQQMAAWLFIRWLCISRHQAKLAEASLSLPVSQSAAELLNDTSTRYPQWQQIVALIPFAQSAPQMPDWEIVKPILQDAGWQLFHQPPTPIPVSVILDQIDRTIPEILQMTPTQKIW
jgi:multiple sugar transport system substrate-binding protein